MVARKVLTVWGSTTTRRGAGAGEGLMFCRPKGAGEGAEDLNEAVGLGDGLELMVVVRRRKLTTKTTVDAQCACGFERDAGGGGEWRWKFEPSHSFGLWS